MVSQVINRMILEGEEAGGKDMGRRMGGEGTGWSPTSFFISVFPLQIDPIADIMGDSGFSDGGDKTLRR